MDQLTEGILYILKEFTGFTVATGWRLSELDMDSMDFAELAVNLEGKYGFRLSQSEWNKVWAVPDNTVSDLIDTVRTAMKEQTT